MSQNKHVAAFHELARQQLRETYEKLAPENIDLFNRMYGSIDAIPYDKMPWAYMQMRNTLDKKEGE